MTKENAETAYNKLNALINVVLGAANTIAGRCLYNAIEVLAGDKRLYRHELKRLANEAKKYFDSYERTHMDNFGEKHQLFLDYLDGVEDEVMPHADTMYWSIKSALDRHNESDSELKAKVLLAHVLLEYSCQVYDDLIEKTRTSSGYNFDRFMRPARLTRVLHSWDGICGILCKSEHDIDLNSEPNCLLAFRVIKRILQSGEAMNKAGYNALMLNPEFIEEIGDEDFEILKNMVKGR
ncbi:hypothetical protein E5358_12600 [Palleniella muris]|uniref:Uncharacterized protein n=1 Tax=Palleniella muris TaxID=3038145 RepID=A0AC61QNS2_9BACT|nr:hypothetical protein [Palleniella muris]TGX80491.1 hypothetical protein E5358_12600 [Palleniella muris]